MEEISNFVATLVDGNFPGPYAKGVQHRGILDFLDDVPHASDEITLSMVLIKLAFSTVFEEKRRQNEC
jgi:hypothetical protein